MSIVHMDRLKKIFRETFKINGNAEQLDGKVYDVSWKYFNWDIVQIDYAFNLSNLLRIEHIEK